MTLGGSCMGLEQYVQQLLESEEEFLLEIEPAFAFSWDLIGEPHD
jgi:hypothetical protein